MRRRVIIGKSKGGGVPTPGTGFKMRIQTSSANEIFILPTVSGYNYNATVLWGDGTYSEITEHNVSNSKTYTVPGTYDIEIKGVCDKLNCTSISSTLRQVLSWGGLEFNGFSNINGMFNSCTNLNSLPSAPIKQNASNPITSCDYMFGNCSMNSVPVDLLNNLTSLTSINGMFYNCTNMTSVSAMFNNNTLISNFSSLFQQCTGLTSLPNNIFLNNINATNFNSLCMDCSSLTTLPANLFNSNTLALNYSSAFKRCNKLQLRSDMFGATPNFGTRLMNFSSTFERTSFTGIQGTAPALWSATMNVSSAKYYCFYGAGNSTTSLTNYASIPAAWRT